MSYNWKEQLKLAQRFLRDKGFYRGEIDGLWGPMSSDAHEGFRHSERSERLEEVYETAPPSPDYDSMCRTFGEPGDETNLESFSLPYPMKLAWDMGTTVDTSRCHRKIVKPLRGALQEILDTFGYAWIQGHGLDLFGGIYNFRKVRGGSSTSKHSWGVAIDLNPEDNRNRVPWVDGKQGSTGYATMPAEVIEIFEKHGFKSAARAWGRDAMHFQYTT